MNQKPVTKEPDKHPEKTGVTLFLLVAGLLLLIMAIGWIFLASR